MPSIPYFIFLVLMFHAILHQTAGQTCSPDAGYRCINETAFEYCQNGNVVPDFIETCISPLNCYDGCINICAESEEYCVPIATETTTTESSSTTTELTTTPTATTTEATTELTTEGTSTIETTTELTTTSTPTSTTTETTTELTTEGTSTIETTTELTTTAMPTSTTTETTTELTTEETTSAELTTTKQPTTAVATSTAPTEAPPTEAPFTCESEGEFQDLGNCSNFYLCIPLSSGDFVYIMFSCPDGSQFDSVTKKCSQNATCITPSCNDFGFYCLSTSQVQLCYDSEPPSGDAFTCPTNTYCSMDCQYPCWTDIPCTTTASPSTSTTALPTSTVTTPPTTTAEPFVCSEAGRFPDPANCSLYYLCSPKSSGGFYTMHFACPPPSLYNPNTRQCSVSFTCSPAELLDNSSSTVSTIVTSTSQPFTCEESGRFADPEDCKSYYLCSPKSSGGFYQIHYQCPPTSAYDQNTTQCSASSSINC
ncbi:cell wall protein DAN4-like [Schistocerca piceifrons]|uniref:cell wall protein DAN4-like n=1 Tax=Schistocerca piceifrons TaxID=274613 RepID=UPI001F5EC93E|nr:cell wall protein DAN4-like [Schistocerca piceifrons]